MRLTLTTLLASPDRVVQPGQTAEFDDAEAEALIASGAAFPAVEDVDLPDDPDDDTDPDEGLPSRSATKKDWVAYATSEAGGEMDADEAKKMTRDALATLYHDGA